MALHFFDPDIAQEYGINAAVLIQNISYWIEKNKANDRNFHDGMYWTYSSIKAFRDLFPYMTGRAISLALQKLEDGGILITGNYNKSAYDRTKWYAITEKGDSILQKREMEKPKSENGNAENGEPIPDNITYKDKNISTYNVVIDDFNRICTSLPKVQKLTSSRRTAIRSLLKTDIDYIELFEKVEKSDFLTGRKTDFKASFDWIIKRGNAVKIIEGNYDNRQGGIQQVAEWGDCL